MGSDDFAAKILAWYQLHKRDLPWRRTQDPYKILVSEIMLQQTQVDRVIPKYQTFLENFPTEQALADAPTSKVINLWSGLGYNNRAIRLQKTAQALRDHKKSFPTTAEQLEELPGIGPYTSRAVLAFAFNKDVPVVDTNIRRIFSRVFFSGAGTAQSIDAQVMQAMPLGRARDWNNALMDFGSSICTAQTPQCKKCPVRELCTAHKAGTPDKFFRIAPPQKKFEGSTRQSRGMILRALQEARNHQLSKEEIAKKVNRTIAETDKIVASMVRDGLIVQEKNEVRLP